MEAQTLANCYLAMESDLTIVAALNKIDLPAAEADKRAQEIERVLGIPAGDVLRISAKTGAGVPELLDAVVERIPAPKGDPDAPLQALMFDSNYDAYRGVISSVRVFNGVLRSGARLRYVNAKQDHDAEEVGVRLPALTPVAALGPGEVGYLIARAKDGRRAEGTRVQAVARRERAERRVSAGADRRIRRGGRQPVVDAAPAADRGHRGAVRQDPDPDPYRIRRHVDGTFAATARRDGEDGIP